jgi:hypothetical protein
MKNKASDAYLLIRDDSEKPIYGNSKIKYLIFLNKEDINNGKMILSSGGIGPDRLVEDSDLKINYEEYTGKIYFDVMTFSYRVKFDSKNGKPSHEVPLDSLFVPDPMWGRQNKIYVIE